MAGSRKIHGSGEEGSFCTIDSSEKNPYLYVSGRFQSKGEEHLAIPLPILAPRPEITCMGKPSLSSFFGKVYPLNRPPFTP